MFLKKNNFETLIVGSSRAETHYNCKIIDSVLQTNSYNIGIQGASLPFSFEIFKAYLENSTFPKNVIFNIDYHAKRCDYDTVFMFPRYFPYLKNKKLYHSLRKKDERFFYFRYLPFYSLTYMGDKYVSGALRGFIGRSGKYDEQYFKGYTPILDLNFVPPFQWKYVEYNSCDGDVIYNTIDSIADLCHTNHAKLYLVISPVYSKFSDVILNKNNMIEKLHSKADAIQIPIFDYSNDSISTEASLFADPIHLKEKGAELFTIELTNDLKKIWNN